MSAESETPDSPLAAEILRRRTFAIISHPDAGKTTLTEKLLLYGGALHMAGSIKGRKADRHAVSDWMAMEQERGISITSSVLQFEHQGRRFNLVDTPGHADFSEDTYRALAAVDSAVMLLDAVKGVEERTRRLFEVCHLRRIPIVSMANKMDRPAKDPLELMDEVRSTLGLRVVPFNWPIGDGPDFKGVLDLRARQIHLFDRAGRGATIASERIVHLDDPSVPELIGEQRLLKLLEDMELLEAADAWDDEAFRVGDLSPMFFGSAMTNFGVGAVLDGLVNLAPPPSPRPTTVGSRSPFDENFSAFVFKIQANMNPKHRDRVAFVRVVSGRFERGMDVTIARTGKTLRLSKAHTFVAADREAVEEAVPGDIVGLFDPGQLRLADTLYVGPEVRFQGIPRFAPEHFARVRLLDPTRRKHLVTGLEQLSQEGAIQLFYRSKDGPADAYVGAVGLLQLDVLIERLRLEYNVAATLETSRFRIARWIAGEPSGLAWLESRSDYLVVRDREGAPVLLHDNEWAVRRALQEAKGLKLLEFSPLGPEV